MRRWISVVFCLVAFSTVPVRAQLQDSCTLECLRFFGLYACKSSILVCPGTIICSDGRCGGYDATARCLMVGRDEEGSIVSVDRKLDTPLWIK